MVLKLSTSTLSGRKVKLVISLPSIKTKRRKGKSIATRAKITKLSTIAVRHNQSLPLKVPNLQSQEKLIHLPKALMTSLVVMMNKLENF